jgi:hypothetical protein
MLVRVNDTSSTVSLLFSAFRWLRGTSMSHLLLLSHLHIMHLDADILSTTLAS